MPMALQQGSELLCYKLRPSLKGLFKVFQRIKQVTYHFSPLHSHPSSHLARSSWFLYWCDSTFVNFSLPWLSHFLGLDQWRRKTHQVQLTRILQGALSVFLFTFQHVPEAHVGMPVERLALVLLEWEDELHVCVARQPGNTARVMVARVSEQRTLWCTVTQRLTCVVLLWMSADHLHAQIQALYFFQVWLVAFSRKRGEIFFFLAMVGERLWTENKAALASVYKTMCVCVRVREHEVLESLVWVTCECVRTYNVLEATSHNLKSVCGDLVRSLLSSLH